LRLADYVMQFVAGQGVKHVFLVVGGGAMHLNDALARCPDLQYVCNHHEQASAIAAEAYAKATNNLGVCMVTTGPGGTNAITGLAGAWFDSTPCLFLSGQVKRADRMFKPDGTPLGVRQRGIQEIDIVSVVRPLTKYATTILDPSSIRYHLEKAVHLARSGRPGPVWIDIPIDVQASPIDEMSLAAFDSAELSPTVPSQDLGQQVREIIERFNASERPLLMIGNGVRLAHAEKELHQLLDALGVPVASTWVAMDLIGSDHPLYVSRPGTLAPRAANFALQNCDFLLSIGARLDLPVVGWSASEFARGAHKVMVDIDPAELGKLSQFMNTMVCADAGDFIRGLLHQKSSIAPRDRSCWLRKCNDWKQRYPLIQPQHRADSGPVSIYHLAEVISQEVAPEDQLVSGSSGSGIEIFLFAYPSRKGQRVFHTAGLGAMGFGVPASIGVSLATGKQRTVCVDGDGGFQFNVQELATIAEHNLPLKFFVLNNDGYASIRASQTNFFGQPNIGCGEKTGLRLPDFREVARAYGLKSASIEDQAELRQQVRQVLQTPGPVVCDVKVIADELRAPRVTSVQRPDGSFVSKPLEDLWPFLDRDEFARNMVVSMVAE
jgi:acetolactate synthase I/II/III large subunit